MAGALRALCVGLTSFDHPSAVDFPSDGDPPADPGPAWPALPFAADRARELGAVLARLGYATRLVEEPLPAGELGRLLDETILAGDPADVLVVHILSHGRLSRTGALQIVGADGRTHKLTDVEHWVRTVLDQHRDTPVTLFLLDVCFAGAAARAQWQVSVPAGDNRAWVIAACASDESAFNGRFTAAVTGTLRALADGDLDIERSVRHVPLTTVARKIRQAVSAAGDGGLDQQVVATLLDISSEPPDVPFFRNPGFDPRRMVRPAVDGAVAPFLDDLDETLDATHFVVRAGGNPDDHYTGCFSGRRRELKILAPWINLQPGPGLRVLTGSPGAGKSAILGVLVCAAHPRLRDATQSVWEHVEQVPYPNPTMAAVHARQRTLEQITASIARQLGVEPGADPLPGLLAALTRTAEPPVIILDALDEAIGGADIMRRLLLPMTTLERPDGRPVRLLVGVRPWPEFEPLRAAARAAGGLIDLDRADPRRLAEDIGQYVAQLMLSDRRWNHLRYEGPARSFARAVAETLTGDSDHEWGAFLVAGLFTQHVLRAFDEPFTDVDRAVRLGATVPRTLPAVLDLDLDARSSGPVLRTVLTALANARGDGMPADLAARVAGALTGGPPPEAAQVRTALEQVRFYLRSSAGTGGTTAYRLFHQGLADHLRRPEHAGPILTALLATVPPGPGGTRLWALAEPYLLRHIAEHADLAGRTAELAADHDFLLTAEPAVVSALLTTVLPAATARRFARLAGADRRWRRHALAALALSSLDVPSAVNFLRSGDDPAPWLPLWASRARPGPWPAAVGVVRRRPVVAFLTSLPSPRPRPGDHPSVLLDAAVVVADVGTRAVVAELRMSAPAVRALHVGTAGGHDLLVLADALGEVTAYDLRTRHRFGVPVPLPDVPDLVRVETLGGQPVVLVAGPRSGSALYDLRTGRSIARLSSVPGTGALIGDLMVRLGPDPTYRVPADLTGPAAVGAVDGRPVLFVVHADGETISGVDHADRRVDPVAIGESVQSLHATDDGHLVVLGESTVVAFRYCPASPGDDPGHPVRIDLLDFGPAPAVRAGPAGL